MEESFILPGEKFGATHIQKNSILNTANAINPGGIHTSLQQHLSHEDLLARGWIDQQGNWLTSSWKSPQQGAA